MSNQNIVSYCRNCCRRNNSKILSEHSESHREDYQCDISYQVVECLGCNTKSFREVFYDLQSAYPTHDEGWVIPEDVTFYPKVIEGHKEINDFWDIPTIVNTIYKEVLKALRDDSKILAGLGLRAAVEAVCKDLNITGKNLEIRINKLVTSGNISKNDAERLHGIRFMGNDAAHEIKTPSDATLSVALQIVEHLITSVYILKNKANGNIDTTVSKYDSFVELLSEKIKGFNAGDEYPIAKFLGKDTRRVNESLSELESELISRIGKNEFTSLSVGKVDKFLNSSKPLQHFIVT